MTFKVLISGSQPLIWQLLVLVSFIHPGEAKEIWNTFKLSRFSTEPEACVEYWSLTFFLTAHFFFFFQVSWSKTFIPFRRQLIFG